VRPKGNRMNGCWKLIVAGVIAALALPAGAAPAAEGDEATRTVLLDPDPRGSGPFRNYLRRFSKETPKGHKIRLLFVRYFNMNTGRSGEMVRTVTIVDANGVPDGVEEHYHSQFGRVRRLTYKKGAKDGEEQFFKYGGGRQPSKIVPWKNGEIHGVVKTFYPSGELLGESPHVKGKAHGVSKTCAKDGFVLQTIPYKEGKRHGTMIEHWADTKKRKSEIPYKDGKVHGTVRQYYRSGKRKREIRAWEDKFHGIEKVYDEEGKLTKTQYWILDERVPKKEFDVKYRVPPIPATPPKAGAAKPAKRPSARPADGKK